MKITNKCRPGRDLESLLRAQLAAGPFGCQHPSGAVIRLTQAHGFKAAATTADYIVFG